MDSNGIINQINEWYDNDPKHRCAFVLLVEKDKEEITNSGCIGGSKSLMKKALAHQINLHKDTNEVIKDSLTLSALIKLKESIKE